MPKAKKHDLGTVAMRHPDGGDFEIAAGPDTIHVTDGRAAVPAHLVVVARLVGLVPDESDPDEETE